MKFDVLHSNLLLEADEAPAPAPAATEPPPANQPAPGDQAPAAPDTDKIPTPEKFDDVQPMPKGPTVAQQKIEELITRLTQMAEELNGVKTENSIQQVIYSLDSNNSVYAGISKVSNDVTSAAGYILDVANALSQFAISSTKRARDLALSNNR
jgi:hypothetical protein